MDCRISKIAKVAKLRVAFYIQDETPKLVAKAVRIVMAMWMIFCQMFLFSMFFPIYV